MSLYIRQRRSSARQPCLNSWRPAYSCRDMAGRSALTHGRIRTPRVGAPVYAQRDTLSQQPCSRSCRPADSCMRIARRSSEVSAGICGSLECGGEPWPSFSYPRVIVVSCGITLHRVACASVAFPFTPTLLIGIVEEQMPHHANDIPI